MNGYTTGFIGAGNIATAIIGGAIKSGYITSDSIYIYDPDPSKCENLSKYGVSVCTSEGELTRACDFVFLTVKPQVYPDVLDTIKDVSDGTCFVDVAAGITVDFVKQSLGSDLPVVRVMPNTPLLYGCGASALVKRDPVTDEQFDFVKGFFENSGVTCVVDESLINTVTAISGSAPAYVMRFARDIIAYAAKQGMNRADAEKLVLQTFIGSAKMVLESDVDIDELIRRVTSPKGTTEAGLRSLDSLDFENTVDACLDATVKRAEELTK